MQKPAFEGLFAILPTPFRADGELDEDGLRTLVRFCADRGLDGAVVLGSAGEFPYLRFEEKRRAMAAAADAAEGRIPVIGTASAHSTGEAVELAEAAKAAGCSAVMAALPFYFALDRAAVVEHFATLARDGGLPVFFYHYPAATGFALTPDEVAEIAALDGVVGAKITVMNRAFLRDVIAATRAHDFRVFAGATYLLPDCVAAGGAGAFCLLPLLAPDEVRAYWSALRAGDMEGAHSIEDRLLQAMPLLSGIAAPAALQAAGFRALSQAPYDATPVPLPRPAGPQALFKEALRQQGHPITNAVRRPFRAVDAAASERVRELLDTLGWRNAPAG